MKKQRILSLLLILAISFTYNIGFAEDTGSEPQLFQAEAVEAAQENGIMVMYNNYANTLSVQDGIALMSDDISDVEVQNAVSVGGTRVELLKIETQDMSAVLADLNNNPNIICAEPNYKVEPAVISDPHYDEQWGLQPFEDSYGISAEAAWEITTGSDDVIVAVLDTGVDISHEDLSGAIWENTAETANGQDDDGNGYIDDLHGWDFANGDGSVYDDTKDFQEADEDSHGTHAAGIIAAQHNGKGIRGVASNIRIMPLKFLRGNDGGFTFDAVEGILYAEKMGASIVNCSWGSYGYSSILESVMAESDMLFVCAAGNDFASTDEITHYPSGYDLPNVISVAALSTNGFLCDFSNFGSGVDIAAPGRNIYSTLPKNRYGAMDGTSMAAPFVSGIAALVKSNVPTLSAKMIRQKILAGHRELANGKQLPKISANAYGALSISLDTPQPNIPRYGASAAETSEGIVLIGGYDGEGQYVAQIEKYDETTNKWLNPFPITSLARAFQGSVSVAGRAYLMGGYGNNGISKEVYSFNGSSYKYEGQMPAGAYAMGAASDDADIYTIGGVNNDGYLSDFRRYNVKTKVWQTLPDLPVKCGYSKAACWNGFVYVFGGANESGCLSDVYRFNIAENQWETCASMNIARSHMEIYQANDKLYLLGGQVNYTEDGKDGIINQLNGWTALQTPAVEEYDPAIDAWTKMLDLPQNKSGFSVAEINEEIMLYGGFDGEISAEGFSYLGVLTPKLRVSTNGRTVKVAWDQMTGAAGYQIEVNGQVSNAGTEAVYTHTVQAGTMYQYRVRAVFADGNGPWSSYVYKTPHDSKRDAKEIGNGTAVNDKLYYRGQEIWYRFTPETAGTLNITLSNIPQECLYRMALYNETGTVIINDVDQDGNKVVENLSVLPYNYYIKVFSDLGANASQAFSLMVNFVPSAEDEIPLRMQMSALQQNITTVTPDSITDAPANSISYVPPVSLTAPDIWANAVQVSSGTHKECTVTESAPAEFQIYVPNGKKLVVVTRPKDGKTIGVPNVYDLGNGNALNDGYIRFWENDDQIASTHYVPHSSKNYGVLVSAKPGELPNGKRAVFEVDFYIVDTHDSYEPNQNFDDGTAGTPLSPSLIGDSSRYTAGIRGLTFDTAADEDYYHLRASEGEKITVCLETFGGMKASDCAFYLFSNMRTEENGTWTDYWYTINKYENPSPPQASEKMKYMTYIAPAAGDYYIYLRHKNGAAKDTDYKLTATKTSVKGDLTGEQYGESLTNDFITYNGNIIAETLLSSLTGRLDNQLDIDWYRIPVGNTTQTKTITLDGADALKRNSVLVLYDLSEQQFITQSPGSFSITYAMESGKEYFVGITPKTAMAAWNSIQGNADYTLSVKEPTLTLNFKARQGGKFILSTNPEYIDEHHLGENHNMLDHYEALAPDKYTYMGWFHNGTSAPIYTDVLFNAEGSSNIRINRLGLQVFSDKQKLSWTGIQAYSDFLGEYIDNEKGAIDQNPSEFYPTSLDLPREYTGPVWLSDIYRDAYKKPYPSMNNYDMPIYIIMEFEVRGGSSTLSTVAYRTNTNREELELITAPYVQGVEVGSGLDGTPTTKGMADSMPIVETDLLKHTIAPPPGTDSYHTSEG